MKLRNNILVLDCETVGNFGQPLIHDFAYCIIDKNGIELVKRNYLVSTVVSTQWCLDYSDFYKSKKELYESLREVTEQKTWSEIEKIMLQDMTRYKVSTISAYNLAFDFRAIRFTSSFLNNGSTKLIEKIQKKKLLCIWWLACETILNNPFFKEWAKANNKISKKGNYITNAEVTYGFINDYPDFVEQHSALQDVLDEVDILNYIRKNANIKVEYGLKYGCWQKIRDKKEQD